MEKNEVLIVAGVAVAGTLITKKFRAIKRARRRQEAEKALKKGAELILLYNEVLEYISENTTNDEVSADEFNETVNSMYAFIEIIRSM